jgi:hypothetical protein
LDALGQRAAFHGFRIARRSRTCHPSN